MSTTNETLNKPKLSEWYRVLVKEEEANNSSTCIDVACVNTVSNEGRTFSSLDPVACVVCPTIRPGLHPPTDGRSLDVVVVANGRQFQYFQ